MYKNVLKYELVMQNNMNKTIGLYIFIALTTLSMVTISTASADLTDLVRENGGPTFTSEGTINTLTGNNYTWLLSGNWDFQSINGITDSFNVDMTMIASNGTNRHHMLITNFTQSEDSPINMTKEGNILINGTSDIYGHGKLKWSAVPTDVSIDQYNVLHLLVDNNQTEDHFNGGIHGTTNSFMFGFDFNRESTEQH